MFSREWEDTENIWKVTSDKGFLSKLYKELLKLHSKGQVAHTCNPVCSAGRDQEDHSLPGEIVCERSYLASVRPWVQIPVPPNQKKKERKKKESPYAIGEMTHQRMPTKMAKSLEH
jgi:hypothetical protein